MSCGAERGLTDLYHSGQIIFMAFLHWKNKITVFLVTSLKVNVFNVVQAVDVASLEITDKILFNHCVMILYWKLQVKDKVITMSQEGGIRCIGHLL